MRSKGAFWNKRIPLNLQYNPSTASSFTLTQRQICWIGFVREKVKNGFAPLIHCTTDQLRSPGRLETPLIPARLGFRAKSYCSLRAIKLLVNWSAAHDRWQEREVRTVWALAAVHMRGWDAGRERCDLWRVKREVRKSERGGEGGDKQINSKTKTETNGVGEWAQKGSMVATVVVNGKVTR